MVRRVFVVAGALVVAASAAAAMGSLQMANAFERFDARAAEWRARASLLVEQHDAHITALEAVELAAGDAVFRQVADQITAAYPRILAIESISKADVGLSLAASGQYQLAEPTSEGAIRLTIDATALLPTETASFVASVALPNGTILAGTPVEDAEFEAVLDSDSQPLLLSASPLISPTILFPLLQTSLAISGALLTYGMAMAAWGQWAVARRAERRALHGEQMARLEHASRVNGLGEMAAGIAHEITQPLTAILGQAQAGRRLLDQGNVVATRAVLDETVAQSKRAAAILDRLRKWIRFEEHVISVVPLQLVVENVASLLASELAQRGVRLEQDGSGAGLAVRADAVQLEQVVFNLVRNALDAAPPGAGRVVIRCRAEKKTVVLEVEDNGPGIAEAVRRRLFEPFVTSKKDGLGLGLVLCQRLVDRMGGTIGLMGGAPTTFRVTLPGAHGG